MDKKRLKRVRNQASKVKRNLKPNENVSETFSIAVLKEILEDE